MTLISNSLVKQVDLPVWEWTRPTPVGATAGLSATCVADSPLFNEVSGRFIYLLANATGFYRYDTYADSYMQLASPGITPLTASSIQFAGAQGYYGRAISGTSNTILTGLPFGEQAVGYRIRITSGRGAGQERLITSVSDPIVADSGAATAGAATSLTDTAKRWGFNGTVDNANNWVGYVVRVIGGTGLNQVRKIIYNNNNILTIADQAIYAYDNWCAPISPVAGTIGWTAPVAGSIYQIEASTITVDTDWSIIPDNTSKYVIQSGGVWLASSAAVASGGITFQYYCVLGDMWYAKSTNNTFVPVVATDLSLERITENSSIWYTGKATTGTTTTLQDTLASWTVNQWAGYKTFIWSGAGKTQLGSVVSNTVDTLTFSPALSTPLDSTSRYNIMGYDAGTLTTSTGRIIFDNTKNWTTNQWANFSVRILSGTGDGQLRQILSNGKDSLVLYDPWNVQPNSTSVYAIQGNSSDMFLTVGSNAETFIYRAESCDMITHGRPLDEGVVCAACAILVDGTSTATHEVFDNKPVPLTSISGTTTITATTAQPHQFKVGQWVSIRGVTSGANDQFNVTGKVQILTCPTLTTFTYTPFAAGSGTYQYSNNVTISTSVIPDASKYHADNATGGSTTTVTFSRAQPSNINGWYVYGTNIADGAQVVSGAGTTTITLNLTGAGTPTGVIIFTKWPRPVTATYSSGGGGGLFNLTLTGTFPAYAKGWLAQGTNIGVGATVAGGEGSSTINLTIPSTGTPAGTITFSSPVNNLLPATVTYSTGTGSTITFTTNSPSYVRGWWVSGTNIPSGAVVTDGESSSTITISNPLTASPSGTITFYPPSTGPAMFYGTTNAPGLAATGFLATGTAMQLIAQNVSNGTIMTPLTALGLITVPGQSRFVVARRDMFGQFYDGQNINYLSGVAVGTQSVTTLADNNAFWGHATGSGGSAGATSFTLSAIGSPYHNGWFVSGTNISTGTKVLSGGGTTSINIDTPLIGAVSGGVTFSAWNQSLVGRRLRILSSTGVNQELAITAVNTGSVTFGTATAPASGSSSYAILPTIVPGAGTALRWISDSSVTANKGKYLFRVRGSAVAGVDKFDITTDKIIPIYYVHFAETLGAGSQYAYDGYDRLYFTKDVTKRFYYLDLNTNIVYGAGQVPYLAGTAGIGNLMEVFKTRDGLKYLFVVRKANIESFRQLLFY